jgi:hypothetical protein
MVEVFRLIAENKAESMLVMNDTEYLPRKGELFTVFNNRFIVNQLEWVPLEDKVRVYVEDAPVEKIEEKED